MLDRSVPPARVDSVVVVEGAYGLEQNVFSTKLREVLERHALPFELWAWARSPEEESTSTSYPRRFLHRSAGARGGRLAMEYVAWITRVLIAALRHRRPSLFICSRFDTAFPLAVASLVACRPFVFLNRDNIAKSYRWPRLAQRLLAHVERWVAGRAVVHLVPGYSRWPTRDDNLRVVPNTPTRAMMTAAAARARTIPRSREDALVVYLNGWLTRTRGTKTILEALRAVAEQARVEVLVAGTPECAEAFELLRLPQVRHLGHVPAIEALSLYHVCDLALTYYDPSIEINRLAEPNKWGDCVATRTPFIANVEIETARPFVDGGACFVLPYHDHVSLAALLTELSQDRTRLVAVKAALGAFETPPWDEAMADVLTHGINQATHQLGAKDRVHHARG
jgi:hypothetical protein